MPQYADKMCRSAVGSETLNFLTQLEVTIPERASQAAIRSYREFILGDYTPSETVMKAKAQMLNDMISRYTNKRVVQTGTGKQGIILYIRAKTACALAQEKCLASDKSLIKIGLEYNFWAHVQFEDSDQIKNVNIPTLKLI